MRVSLAEIFGSLAKTLSSDATDDATFGSLLVQFFRTLAIFDNCVAFAYRGEARPLELFDTFTPPQRHVHVTLYNPGPYLLDPFFRAATQRSLGFWRMRELAPDRFFQSEYYRSYYFETGLAEEVGFFVGTDLATVVVISLMRTKSSGAFSRAEIAALRQSEPVVTALIARYWRDVGSRFKDAGALAVRPWRTDAIRSTQLSAWRGLDLTAREAAVVDLVLQGHSSEAIAGRLGIAPGTVKVHRRNVYRKLEISSQTELLAIYLDRLLPRN